MLISERIFELLMDKGMSQREFSQKTGISQSTISDWKHKKTNPASDKIMLICDVLHITPYELLAGIEKSNYTQLDYVIVDKKSIDYTFLEIMHSFNKLEKERLLGYMQALQEKKNEKMVEK